MSELAFVQRLASAPWFCDEETVARLHGIYMARMERVASGQKLDVKELELSIGRPLDNTRQVTIRDGVARIPVEGPIFRRANLFTEISGAVSTAQLAKDFETAMNDAMVHSVLFVFDTPGGEATGIHELATMILQRREEGSKRIEAYCDGACASAGYHLAVACERITASNTATVGSIGTAIRLANPDAYRSTDLEFVNSNSPKKWLNPSSPEGRSAVQAWINDLGNEFIAFVAKARSRPGSTVTFEKVVEDFGQGFVMTGTRALAAGMVDALDTEENVVRRLALARGERPSRPAAIASEDHDEREAASMTTGRHDNGYSDLPQAREAEEEKSARGIVAGIKRLLGGEISGDGRTLTVQTPPAATGDTTADSEAPPAEDGPATTTGTTATEPTEGSHVTPKAEAEVEEGQDDEPEGAPDVEGEGHAPASASERGESMTRVEIRGGRPVFLNGEGVEVEPSAEERAAYAQAFGGVAEGPTPAELQRQLEEERRARREDKRKVEAEQKIKAGGDADFWNNVWLPLANFADANEGATAEIVTTQQVDGEPREERRAVSLDRLVARAGDAHFAAQADAGTLMRFGEQGANEGVEGEDESTRIANMADALVADERAAGREMSYADALVTVQREGYVPKQAR